MNPSNRCPVIASASQKCGTGTVTTAMNLACAFSQHGLRVLAIDADDYGALAAEVLDRLAPLVSGISVAASVEVVHV